MISHMNPSPKELRIRVVAAVDAGDYSIPQVAQIFNASPFFIKKMLRLSRLGTVAVPKPFFKIQRWPSSKMRLLVNPI